MLTQDLNGKWLNISQQPVQSGYRSLRISANCIPELFLGVGVAGERCLILSLPSGHGVEFDVIKKAKVSIELHRESRYLILTLLDSGYLALFDDLVMSLYNTVKDIVDVTSYSKVFIQTFFKWSEFFEDEQTDKLSRDIVKGLFGELIVLRSLVQETTSLKVNDILDAWRGPYGNSHDFVLDQQNIEVKTKDASKLVIRLSSEYQLDNSSGKTLELLVVSVEQDPVGGIAIKELVFEIKQLVVGLSGDVGILFKAIYQKGLTSANIHIYDNYRFRLVKLIKYDCTQDEFPKLIKSELPVAIGNVKYDINLSSLAKFIISKVEF